VGLWQVAVACIKVASQAVACIPSMLVFPIFPYIAKVILVTYWVAVTAFLYSSGSIAPHSTGAQAAAYSSPNFIVSVSHPKA
jgi:Plasma-membrane choline transporter